MTLDILRRYGYNVYTARSGLEALIAEDKLNGSTHLLLTDVVMPGMNGKELFNQMSVRQSGLKAIYMSGYTDDGIAHRGVMEEAVNFIQKPFSVEKLAAKIREVLDRP